MLQTDLESQAKEVIADSRNIVRISPRKAAEIIGISEPTVRAMCMENEFPGGTVLIRKNAQNIFIIDEVYLRSWIEHHTQKNLDPQTVYSHQGAGNYKKYKGDE